MTAPHSPAHAFALWVRRYHPTHAVDLDDLPALADAWTRRHHQETPPVDEPQHTPQQATQEARADAIRAELHALPEVDPWTGTRAHLDAHRSRLRRELDTLTRRPLRTPPAGWQEAALAAQGRTTPGPETDPEARRWMSEDGRRWTAPAGTPWPASVRGAPGWPWVRDYTPGSYAGSPGPQEPRASTWPSSWATGAGRVDLRAQEPPEEAPHAGPPEAPQDVDEPTPGPSTPGAGREAEDGPVVPRVVTLGTGRVYVAPICTAPPGGDDERDAPAADPGTPWVEVGGVAGPLAVEVDDDADPPCAQAPYKAPSWTTTGASLTFQWRDVAAGWLDLIAPGWRREVAARSRRRASRHAKAMHAAARARRRAGRR